MLLVQAPSRILYTFLDIDKFESSKKSIKYDPKTKRIDLWGNIRGVKNINCLAKKWLMGDTITAYWYLKTTGKGKAFFSRILKEHQGPESNWEAKTYTEYQEKLTDHNYHNLRNNFLSRRGMRLLLVAFKHRLEKFLKKHMYPQLQKFELQHLWSIPA